MQTKILIALSIIFILLLSGCTQTKQPATEKYSNKEGGFEAEKLPGWSAEECKEKCRQDKPVLSLSRNGEASMLVFSRQAVSSDIEKTMSEVRDNINSVKGAKITVKSEKEIPVSGTKGKHLILEAEADSVKATQELAAFYKNGKIFVLTATYKTPADSSAFLEFLASFKAV